MLCPLERPTHPPLRAGEGARLVPDQLILEEGFRQFTARDGHKGP